MKQLKQPKARSLTRAGSGTGTRTSRGGRPGQRCRQINDCRMKHQLAGNRNRLLTRTSYIRSDTLRFEQPGKLENPVFRSLWPIFGQ